MNIPQPQPCIGDQNEGGDPNRIRTALRPTVVSPASAEHLLRAEVRRAARSAGVALDPVSLTSLQEAIVDCLGWYFTNNVDRLVAPIAPDEVLFTQAEREALLSYVGEQDADAPGVIVGVSDVEIVSALWRQVHVDRPWHGMVLGESMLAFFGNVKGDDQAESLRATLASWGSGFTIWHPLSARADASAPGPKALRAEFLIHAAHRDEEGTQRVLPYVLRLRYDPQRSGWIRESLWTPGANPPRLIF